MSEAEIVTFCLTNYAIKNAAKIKNDLRNLEVMVFLNPHWKIGVAQTDTYEGAVTEENIVKNMVGALMLNRRLNCNDIFGYFRSRC